MDIRSIIYQWQAEGIFDFVLPFLLIFAFAFGILEKTRILGDKNKGINVVIAVALGLLILQSEVVPQFFRELFPQLGVSLAVMFTLLILIYLFLSTDADKRKGWDTTLATIGMIIGVIIVLRALGNTSFGSGFSFSWDQWIGYLVGAVLLIGVIIAVANSGDKPAGS
jgi:peptidoglycan/LPS O-acetylase OafA/YrhL